jgi:3-methyl-2-oxobutanoate hydroxymethyltransferase
MEDVFTRYRDEVKDHTYPGPEHTVYMPEDERKEFQAMMQWSPKEGGA